MTTSDHARLSVWALLLVCDHARPAAARLSFFTSMHSATTLKHLGLGLGLGLGLRFGLRGSWGEGLSTCEHLLSSQSDSPDGVVDSCGMTHRRLSAVVMQRVRKRAVTAAPRQVNKQVVEEVVLRAETQPRLPGRIQLGGGDCTRCCPLHERIAQRLVVVPMHVRRVLLIKVRSCRHHKCE